MKTLPRRIFHLLPNAHLDPVWLWDWREGLNEGVTTVRTVLDLMDERPELTFIRGEAVIYRHIQKTAPALFRRIREKIDAGRWDVVGGTWVQPDSNLAATETLCRHFDVGLRYFQRELGVRPTAAWQADSFGHTAGWPNILRDFGMEGFAFTRPQRAQFPLESPAFWWECDHDDRLLCYRQHGMWYCTERGNVPALLDDTLTAASKQPWENVGVLIGLGNHGGGPTRRHLADVDAWRARHPEIEVRYSTLHGLFTALRAELEAARVPAPSVRGELGYCLRGCNSAVQKFKSLYRHTEQALAAAEVTQSIVTTTCAGSEHPLAEAWESVLFNSFHDILPGSSIERAVDEQTAWTGLAMHHAHQAGFNALNQLAEAVDTRVPAPPTPDAPTQVPVLVWNPLPRPFHGPVEIETSLDYRPFFSHKNRADELPFALCDAKGRGLPFQEVATEHSSMPGLPWRKRVVAHLTIPALGWQVVRLGIAEKKPASVRGPDACTAGGDVRTPWISNSQWRVGVGGTGRLDIEHEGKAFLSGRNGLRLVVVEDPWGSWGGMEEEPHSWQLDQVREEWHIVRSEVLERGPERARLWTRWEGRNSWAELTFDTTRSSPWITIHGRMLWNERSARLQLVLPSSGPAWCDVPGGTANRTGRGQVSVGRWFQRRSSAGGLFGVATDVLGDADFLATETRLTLARASRYANDVETGRDETPWQPAVDCGELKFKLHVFAEGVVPDQAADALTTAPMVLVVPPSPGTLPSTGSLGALSPQSVRLLALQREENGGVRLRVQNRGARTVTATFTIAGRNHALGRIKPQQIVTTSLNLAAE